MGSGCRRHNAPRRRHRILLPDERLHLVARVDHGARRRRVCLFGNTRSTRRNVEAWQEARFDELCTGGRSNRSPQRWVAAASLTLRMHSFHYRDCHLHCEDVDLTRVAEEFGTPTYVYSAGTILDHYKRLGAALAPLDHLICYAVKANSNRAILKLLADAGAGFDIVSGGELFRVLAAGPAGAGAKCTFAGVGKSPEEIEYALEQRVYSFNIESQSELECIDRIANATSL